MDHRFSDADNFSGTFVYDATRLTQPDSLNNEYFLNSNSRPFGSLEETHIFTPSLVNSVRAGFSRNSAVSTTSTGINPLASDLSTAQRKWGVEFRGIARSPGEGDE